MSRTTTESGQLSRLGIALQPLGDDLLRCRSDRRERKRGKRGQERGWQAVARCVSSQRRRPRRRRFDHQAIHRWLRVTVGKHHEAEGVRAAIRDHGDRVRGAGRALRLDEEVAPAGLRGDAPCGVGLRTVAAEARGDFGDGLVGIEHDERDDASLHGDGDNRLRVVDDFAQARIARRASHWCLRPRDRRERAEHRDRTGRSHGFAPGDAVLISGSDRYATTTNPNGFSSRSFSFASTLGWYW